MQAPASSFRSIPNCSRTRLIPCSQTTITAPPPPPTPGDSSTWLKIAEKSITAYQQILT
jgi:hypothetical protein